MIIAKASEIRGDDRESGGALSEGLPGIQRTWRERETQSTLLKPFKVHLDISCWGIFEMESEPTVYLVLLGGHGKKGRNKREERRGRKR